MPPIAAATIAIVMHETIEMKEATMSITATSTIATVMIARGQP